MIDKGLQKPISRKEFLKKSSLVAVSLPCFSILQSCQGKMTRDTGQDEEMKRKYVDHMGLQLYTVRKILDNDPGGVIRKISELGYKEIEVHRPQRFSTEVPLIKDHGMEVVSCHIPSPYITGRWEDFKGMGNDIPENIDFEKIIDDSIKHGIKCLGVPILFPYESQSLDAYRHFADLANQAGELCDEAGIRFFYHNHSFEFEPKEGTTPMDVLAQQLDPALVSLELDVFWTAISGNDPIVFMEKFPDLVKLLHLKDLQAGRPVDFKTFGMDEEAFEAVGDGYLDFRSILQTAHDIGVDHTFVEQDHSQIDELQSIGRSIEHLREIGL